jgi:hypothetical protein
MLKSGLNLHKSDSGMSMHIGPRKRPMDFSDFEKMRREMTCSTMEHAAEEKVFPRSLYKKPSRPNSSEIELANLNNRLSVKVCYVNLLRHLEENPAAKLHFKALIRENKLAQLRLEISKQFKTISSCLNNFRQLKPINEESTIEEIVKELKHDIFKSKQAVILNSNVPEHSGSNIERMLQEYVGLLGRLQEATSCLVSDRPVYRRLNSRINNGKLLCNERVKRIVRDLLTRQEHGKLARPSGKRTTT